MMRQNATTSLADFVAGLQLLLWSGQQQRCNVLSGAPKLEEL